jgi:hypothetical protein
MPDQSTISAPDLESVSPEATYVFCYARPGAAQALSEVTLADYEVLRTVTHRSVAAIISHVPRAACAGMRRIHRERTVAWVRRHAARHEEILTQAMLSSPVLPLPLGTVVGSSRQVCDIIEQEYSRIDAFLNHIQGKEEWTLRGRLELGSQRTSLRGAIGAEYSWLGEPGRLGREPSRLHDLRGARACARLLEAVLLDRLERIAHIRQPRRLAAVPPGPVAAMELFNWALLIPCTEREQLREKVHQSDAAMAEQGIFVELSGPWPAYSFASGVLEAAPEVASDARA